MFDLKKAEKQREICNLVCKFLNNCNEDLIDFDFRKERTLKNNINTLIKNKICFVADYEFIFNSNFFSNNFLYEFYTKEDCNYDENKECSLCFRVTKEADEKLKTKYSSFRIIETLIFFNLDIEYFSYKFENLELDELEKILKDFLFAFS